MYHKGIRKLKEKIEQLAAEFPLDYADKQDETMLYSTHEEKVAELRYRVRSTRRNISNSTRMMRREGRTANFPFSEGRLCTAWILKSTQFYRLF